MATAELMRGGKGARGKAMKVLLTAGVDNPDGKITWAEDAAAEIRKGIGGKLTDARLNRALKDHFGGDGRLALGTAIYKVADEQQRRTARVETAFSKAMLASSQRAKGESYAQMKMRTGIDLNALLKAIPVVARWSSRKDAEADTGEKVTLTGEEKAKLAQKAEKKKLIGGELIARIKAANTQKPVEKSTKKDAEAADGEALERVEEDLPEELRELAVMIEKEKLAHDYLLELLEGNDISLDNPESMVALMRAVAEEFVRSDPKFKGEMLGDDIWASPAARAVFVDTAARATEAVMRMYTPARVHARIASRIQLLRDSKLNKMEELERVLQAVFVDLNRDVIRQTQQEMIADLKKDLKPFVKESGDSNKVEAQRTVPALMAKWARKVNKAIGLNEFELQREIAKYEATIAAKQSGQENAPLRDVREAREWLDVLNAFGALRKAMPAEIQEKGDRIRAMLDGELQAFLMRKAEREAQTNAAAEQASAAVVPKKDNENPEPGRFAQYMHDLVGMMAVKGRQLTRFCLDNDVRQRGLGAFELLEEVGQKAATVESNFKHDADVWLHEAITAIFGSAGEAQKALYNELDRPLWAQLDRGRQSSRWNMNKVLQMYVSIVQEDYAGNTAKWERDGAYLALLESLIGKDERFWKLIDALRDYYARIREPISETRLKEVGLPLDAPNPLYMPVKMYRGEKREQEQAVRVRAFTPFASSLTSRVRNGLDFDQEAGIIEMWERRRDETARTLAYAENGQILESVMLDNRLLDAIKRAHGKKEATNWRNYAIDILAGPQSANEGTEGQLLSGLAKWSSRFWLFGNPSSWTKQLASIPALAFRVDGLSHHLMAWVRAPAATKLGMRELVASQAYKGRYASAIAPDMAAAMGKGVFGSKMDKVFDAGMKPLTWFDQWGALIPGAHLYLMRKLHLMQQGIAEAEAKEMAAEYVMARVDATAQTNRVINQTMLQRRGGMAAKVLQFASSPIQQMQYELVSIQEWWADRKNPEKIKRMALDIALNHLVIPAGIALIDSLIIGATGEWGDERKRKRRVAFMIASFLSGSWGCVFIAGAFVDEVSGFFGRQIVNATMSGPKATAYNMGTSLIPATSLIDELFKIKGDLADAIMSATEADWQQSIDSLLSAAAETTAPTRLIKRVVKGWGGEDKK